MFWAKIGSIVILGGAATYLVIIGLSGWLLDGRRRVGSVLLLLGFLGWIGGIFLCAAFASGG